MTAKLKDSTLFKERMFIGCMSLFSRATKQSSPNSMYDSPSILDTIKQFGNNSKSSKDVG
jgi:hypothetical protein